MNYFLFDKIIEAKNRFLFIIKKDILFAFIYKLLLNTL